MSQERDLFSEESQPSRANMLDCPLPERARPRQFSAFHGQAHIWNEQSPLRRLVNADKLGAWIFWGPPGCGKTSLALLIGEVSGRKTMVLSAVESGVKEIRAHIDFSASQLARGEKASLLFIDEIHRLSKSQQDVLLPALESGTVKFIGATTENPSFEVNAAILSRGLVFQFKPLSDDDLIALMQTVLKQHQAEMPNVEVAEDVLAVLARSAAGDGRRALNLLEALLFAAPNTVEQIDLNILKNLGDIVALRYDKKSDHHYDTISAFIKSVRASHPDAALHYLARMLEAGEDPVFIARRLIILASEDIGNASPTALLMATAGLQAIHAIGMPEGRIILAQITTFLASCPKSNKSYVGIQNAIQDVKKFGSLEIPNHLKNGVTTLMKEIGYGQDYKYAHDDPAGSRKLAYLPEKLAGTRYYEPLPVGSEKQLAEFLKFAHPTVD